MNGRSHLQGTLNQSSMTEGRFTLAAGRRAARALQQCNWLLFVFSFHTGAAGREHVDEKSADVACRWQ